MTQDRARKRAIRAHMAANPGLTYSQAARALGLERSGSRPQLLMLPLHDPYTGPGRCRECDGSGIVADLTLEMPGDPGQPTLICAVFCPTCSGCGRAQHTDCRTGQHADPEAVGLDPNGYDDDQDDGETCYSCRGRHWWAMQAFNKNEVFWVRTPCGCSTPLLVPVPADAR